MYRLNWHPALAPLLVALLIPVAAPGAAARDESPAAPEPLTLATALRARPLRDTIVLAVRADAVTLRPGMAPPAPGVSIDAAAGAFGYIKHRFGSVTAIAPASMVLLDTHPPAPDIASSISPTSALTQLAAGLTPEQWQQVVSPRGLGYDDLATPLQQALFHAILPPGRLVYEHVQGGPNAPTDGGMVSDADAAGAHLRLVRKLRLALPVEGKQASFLISPAPSTRESYRLNVQTDRQPQHHDLLEGVRVRSEVPNTLKGAEMDLDSTRFSPLVPLDGLRTVGDLVARIGKLTRTELYVDARWEALPLMILGPAPRVRASDLLKALALDLTGTYRVVGSAAVLTHDLEGAGAQRERLAEFHQATRAKWTQIDQEAVERLSASHSALDLDPDPGTTDFSADQIAQIRERVKNGQDSRLSLAVTELTPQQQTLVQETADYDNRAAELRAGSPQGQAQPESIMRADITGKVRIEVMPALQVLLPSIQAPLDTGEGDTLGWRGRPAGAPAAAPEAPPLAALLKEFPRRAALLAPASARDLDVELASMRRLGLNELWLVVFSSGMPWKSTTGISGERLLKHALEASRGTGVRVLPVMDLLDWGSPARADLRDRTLLREDSVEAAARARSLAPWLAASDPPPPLLPNVLVSPFFPTVSDTLAVTVGEVARQAGVAGMVWRMTSPPGYVESSMMVGGGTGARDSGYTETARLSFLRQFHVDPIDLDPGGVIADNLTLAGFDDRSLGAELSGKWQEFRHAAARRLLDRLASVVREGPAPPPLLILAGGRQEWYGSWDNPRADPPWKSVLAAMPDLAPMVRQISHTILVGFGQPTVRDPASLARALQLAVLHSTWDGCMLDFDPAETPGRQQGNPFAALE